MPDLGGKPQRRKLDLSGTKVGKASTGTSAPGSKPLPGAQRKQVQKQTPRSTLLNEDDDMPGEDVEDEDEIIQASVKSKKAGDVNLTLYIVLGVGVAILVVILFLIFGGKKNPETDPNPVSPSEVVQETTSVGPTDDPKPSGIGIQDFTGNTTMTSDSPLTNPDGFVEDINGLTTRVEYEVTGINNITDFVNYTKKRGTWGGGLELYWLDCTYKGAKYVIQVPFQYYKELDETGIVPVKMEVLQVKQPTGETLIIISYMSLDEATLKNLLKTSRS